MFIFVSTYAKISSG